MTHASVAASAIIRAPAPTALDQLGRQIEWVHSYVTRDRVYCIYRVPSETVVRTTVEKRHA